MAVEIVEMLVFGQALAVVGSEYVLYLDQPATPTIQTPSQRSGILQLQATQSQRSGTGLRVY